MKNLRTEIEANKLLIYSVLVITLIVIIAIKFG